MTLTGFKVIHDSVHGSVRVWDLYLKLLERPEMQRLHHVHQLGLAHLVFPGANHTRLEHSLGTFFISGKMANSLGLEDEEIKEVLAAALLHDLGHPPFSHTMETVIREHTGKDHMELTRSIILGEMKGLPERSAELLGTMEPISDLLESYGLSARRVGDLIVQEEMERVGQDHLMVEEGQAHFGSSNYQRQIIHGPVDADQMDYLLRDAYYTGVAHGTIDLDRILETISTFHGDVVVQKGGVVAIEGLLVARALMYTSIYFHKTVRIAEMMLCKAVELADKSLLDNIQAETDCSLSRNLIDFGGKPARIITEMKYRKLYKKAFSLNTSELEDSQLERLLPLVDYQKRKAKEAEIADRAGVDISDVILDVPSKELMLSEPRIGKTDVPILANGRVKPLSKYSPLARALQYRSVYDWAVMVSCPKPLVEVVEKAANKVIFS